MSQTNKHVNTEDFEVITSKSDGQGGNDTQGWRRKRQRKPPVKPGNGPNGINNKPGNQQRQIREEGSLGRLLEMALRI